MPVTFEIKNASLGRQFVALTVDNTTTDMGLLDEAERRTLAEQLLDAADELWPITDGDKERVREAVADALGEAYDCTRVWSAWGYHTMGPDDFALVAEDPDRVAEIADAAIKAFTAR